MKFPGENWKDWRTKWRCLKSGAVPREPQKRASQTGPLSSSRRDAKKDTGSFRLVFKGPGQLLVAERRGRSQIVRPGRLAEWSLEGCTSAPPA